MYGNVTPRYLFLTADVQENTGRFYEVYLVLLFVSVVAVPVTVISEYCGRVWSVTPILIRSKSLFNCISTLQPFSVGAFKTQLIL